MPEVFEEQKPEPLDIQRYLDIVRRRHIYFLVPFLLGWLIVWGASWVLPARYKSSTLILVEQPTVPKNYVLPNVSDNMQDGLQNITQQILSRTRLLLIIGKFNLYGGNRHRYLTPDQKVELMRKGIKIELVRDAHDDAITSFKISYSAHNPRIAQQVTSELSNLFIKGNLEVRQQQSEGTTSFLKNQLNDASTSLAAQEAKIREFKGEHIGELPTQQTSNLQILSGLQAQLQNEQDALSAAKQQRIYLQTMIEQYRTLRESSHTGVGAPTSLSTIDKELAGMQSKLADLRSRYTELYPNVQSLKDRIAKTERTRAALIAGLNDKGKVEDQPGSAATRDLVDPAQNSPLLQLEGQQQANRAEIKNREQSIASLEARVNDYQGRLNTEPVREQQLDDLTRGYAQSKANYDDLLKKESDSEMATSMEQTQQGERFGILDPPSLPLKPDFPNRLKFCGFGLGAGLVFGGAFVGGLEFMDDRLHGEKEIKDLLPIAVISEIPEIVILSDTRSRRTRAFFGWATAALVLAVVLAGSAFSYLHN